MRKILLLIPLFLFYNCGPEANKFKRTYLIENSFNGTVKLKFYDRRTGESRTRKSKVLTGNQQQLEGTIEQSNPFDNSNNNHIVSAVYGADSLRIIFDKKKVITQVFFTSSETFSEPLNKNVFRHENYEAIGNEKFLFKITEEDYQNATPCDGDCE
jgi:hypothetical protein